MKKVYVNIPASAEAGGCESLYQLVDAINNVGGYATIIWDRNVMNPVPEKYKHYNIKWGEDIEENENNWIIYPEVWTEKIYSNNKLKKSIWWLSVDNNHNKFSKWDDDTITHFYQSYYALNHIQKNGGNRFLYLNDYISENYISQSHDINEKENIVSYNPIKGLDITTQIINNNPNVKFVPIIRMNESEITNLLKKSKIYIDFGHHPGRDRIPRESAHLGCCLITNKKGSSGYYNDITIPNKYKIDDISNVNDLIKNIFEDFESNYNEHSIYRSSIKNQKELLHNLCKQYFL